MFGQSERDLRDSVLKNGCYVLAMFVNKSRKFILELRLSLSFSSEITVESLSRFGYREK